MTFPGSGERQPVSFRDCWISNQLLLEPTLPKIQIVRGNWFDVPRVNRDGRDFVANEPDERLSKCCRQLDQM